MLTPGHSRATEEPALPHVAVSIPAEDVTLRGWLFPAEPRRGTVIFLHGRNQNRSAGVRAAARLVTMGYDVLVYDSRAHGDSGAGTRPSATGSAAICREPSTSWAWTA